MLWEEMVVVVPAESHGSITSATIYPRLSYEVATASSWSSNRKRNKNKDFSWPLKELKSCRSKKEGGQRQREEKLERCHTIG